MARSVSSYKPPSPPPGGSPSLPDALSVVLHAEPPPPLPRPPQEAEASYKEALTFNDKYQVLAARAVGPSVYPSSPQDAYYNLGVLYGGRGPAGRASRSNRNGSTQTTPVSSKINTP